MLKGLNDLRGNELKKKQGNINKRKSERKNGLKKSGKFTKEKGINGQNNVTDGQEENLEPRKDEATKRTSERKGKDG